MKKYLQISVVLGLFGLLVLWRQSQGGDTPPVVGGNQTAIPTSAVDTSIPTISTPTTSQAGSTYKNGRFIGSTEDAFYGNIQVQVAISGGKITDVIFLQHPNDNHTSQSINMQAMPLLKSEAIQAQSAQVDAISGASDTSAAFIKSLGNALSQAKA